MELVFKRGNDNVDLGWASNNSCLLEEIILDERELDDPGSGDAWELQYPPVGLVVRPMYIDPREIGKVSDDLEPGTFVVGRKHELEQLDIPTAMRAASGLPPQAPKTVKLRREGFKLVPGVAVTDYFSQGQTFRGHAVVLDLRIPPDGRVSLSGVYVMLSRATTLEDIYLLHPLWPAGDDAAKAAFIARAQQTLRFDDDIVSAETALRAKHDVTVDMYKDAELHYIDKSVDPERCAHCGRRVWADA